MRNPKQPTSMPREASAFEPVPPPILRPWSADRLVAGFCGRAGGVSVGEFATMNLSEAVGDVPESVAENWRLLRAALPSDSLVARVVQVHGSEIVEVTRDSARERPRADGMVTREAGVVLGILTADCVPVLLCDAHEHVAGALHAGWRGVLGGIAQAGIAAMNSLGADVGSIRAALGPSIGLCCFEVEQDLAERFSAEIPSASRHRRAGRPGKAYLDLRAIVRDQLIEAGLAPSAIESVGPCTRCSAARFFSRRAAGGAVTGLQLSFAGFAAR